MKKKRGFTLIELLAVIVILALLVALAIPAVTKYLDTSRRNAFAINANQAIEAVRKDVIQKGVSIDTTYSLSDINDLLEKQLIKSPFNSLYSDKSNIEVTFIGENTTFSICLVDKLKHGINTDENNINGSNVLNDVDCTGNIDEIVDDSDPGEIICNDSIGEIRSIEDLVFLSTNPNICPSIKLMYDLDFNSPNSYASGKVDKDLLFIPIGTTSNPFNGTFDGNNKTIKNLKINSSESDNIGLFGVLAGTIKNVNMDSITVSGRTNIGALVGSTKDGKSATILNVKLNNINVKATGNYAGGMLGLSNGSNATNIIVNNVKSEANSYAGGVFGHGRGKVSSIIATDVNVKAISSNAGMAMGGALWLTATNIMVSGEVESPSDCGGLVGFSSGGSSISGAVISGSIKGTNAQPFHGYSNGTTKGIISSDVLINGSVYKNAKENIMDINVLSETLDTYKRNDYDGDGYYFDYNDKGIVVLKNTTDSPIVFNLSQDADGYYLINNYNDMRQASIHPEYNYKLMNDINMASKKVYIIGDNVKAFTGIFNGNNKTISNIDLKINDGGLFGVLAGTIKDLNIIDSKISGKENIGILVGKTYSSGVQTYIENINLNRITVSGTGQMVGGLIGANTSNNIKAVKINNTSVTGNMYVGALVGNTYGNIDYVKIKSSSATSKASYVGLIAGCSTWTRINNVVVSGNVKGSTSVGGISGYGSGGPTIKGVVLGGSIEGSGAGRIVSYTNGTTKAYAHKDTLVNGSKVTSSTTGYPNGKDMTDNESKNQTIYEAVGFNFEPTQDTPYYWYFNDGEINFKK